MQIEKIIIDGCEYEALTVQQALEIGATQEEIDAVLKAQNPEPTEQEVRTTAKNEIDKAAGKARVAIAGTAGELIDVEYQITEQQAKEWDAAGRKQADVPESVSAWALASNKSNDEACDDILTKSKMWTAAILKIRAARLAASREVMTCPIGDVNKVVNAFTSKLHDLVQ